jgi:copper chaperone CopZ
MLKFTKSTFFLTVALTLLGSACFRQVRQTIVVSVPDMKSPECAKFIIDNLSPVEGVELIQPNIEQRTLSVTYNSEKLAIKNIEYLITGTGFEANGNPPNPEARKKLPAACR